MSVQEEYPDVWSKDFYEMSDQVNALVENYFEGLSQPMDAEGGCVYSKDGQKVFRFGLAGTVNSDPTILKQGSRAAAFQVFDKEALDMDEGRDVKDLLEDVFKEVDCFEEVRRNVYNGFEVYEVEFGYREEAAV